MSEKKEEPWDLVIGQVTAPFGIRGEMRVRPETDYPERFHQLNQVCLELPDGTARVYEVIRARATPKGILLGLAGCSNPETAAQLRGAWVKIKKSMAVKLPPNHYWLHDLIGVQVIDEKGEELGEIREVIRGPANDVYVTPKVMIPAVRAVVKQVDLEKRRMVVSLPPEEDAEE